MSEKLWIDDPEVLFDGEYIKKFVWLPGMGYNEKLNSLMRFIIIFGLVGFLYFNRIEFIYLVIVAAGIIYYMHNKKRDALVQLLGLDDSYIEQSGGGAGSYNVTGSGYGDLYDGKYQDGFDVEKAEEWNRVYGKNGSFKGFSNPLVSPKIVVDPAANGVCKLSTPDNPFGNALPADNENLNMTPVCNPEFNKGEIENNFQKGLFSNLNDVWGRYNLDRQFITQPSTTIPNDRESFMNWLWETPYVCKDGDMDACFKQGY